MCRTVLYATLLARIKRVLRRRTRFLCPEAREWDLKLKEAQVGPKAESGQTGARGTGVERLQMAFVVRRWPISGLDAPDLPKTGLPGPSDRGVVCASLAEWWYVGGTVVVHFNRKTPLELSLAGFFSDSNRTQTCNLLIRSQMLYSIELWSQLPCGLISLQQLCRLFP